MTSIWLHAGKLPRELFGEQVKFIYDSVPHTIRISHVKSVVWK